jgi:hypothetical protein
MKTYQDLEVENLIDEKYYRQVSNIIYDDDDFKKFLSNIYGYDVIITRCQFVEYENPHLNKYSTCCFLSNNETIYSSYNPVAYYIPENTETLNIFNRSNPKIFKNLRSKTLTFNYSLKYILEQSQKIPIDNSLKDDGYHTYGSEFIIFNNTRYKRIESKFLHNYGIYNSDKICEYIIPLFELEWLDTMNLDESKKYKIDGDLVFLGNDIILS